MIRNTKSRYNSLVRMIIATNSRDTETHTPHTTHDENATTNATNPQPVARPHKPYTPKIHSCPIQISHTTIHKREKGVVERHEIKHKRRP